MTFAIGSDAPWGLVEWTVTGLSTAALGAATFVLRLATKLDRASTAIEWQKAEVAAAKQAADAAIVRLSDGIAELHVEHCRLREVAAALPTRTDLRDMEERLGERLTALAARIDGLLEDRVG
jgi:hypothetical protein